MKLSAYLSDAGISRADFAAKIGVSEVSVTRYINGQRIPQREEMQRIREATRGAVTADDFYHADAPQPERLAS